MFFTNYYKGDQTRTKWARLTHTMERGEIYKKLFRKLEGRRLVGRPRYIRNNSKMNLK
jgi:hypothetical protein